MSNFQCESCGAVYIDKGIAGYETIQCKTTADVIKGLNEKIVLLQNMNKSLNELLSIKDEAITDLTADKIVLKEQLCAKEKELHNVCMKINAANTAAVGNLSLSQLAEDKLQAAVNQYNAVVQQNKELQQELIQTKEKKAQANNEALQIKAFLTEWSSQDNRGMAFPYYYTIADENYRFEQDNGGEYFFDSHAGTIVKITDVLQEEFNNDNIEDVTEEELKDILENIGTCAEDDRIDDWLRNYNDTDIQRYTKEYETYYEGVFFTKTDAEEYLESTMNHHFGENPRIYADSFNKWGRHSQTEKFLNNLFSYFGVKVPPEMYYQNKKTEEAAKGVKNE